MTCGASREPFYNCESADSRLAGKSVCVKGCPVLLLLLLLLLIMVARSMLLLCHMQVNKRHAGFDAVMLFKVDLQARHH